MINLDGQTALVTGGANGIGFGIATALAAAGARVVINDIDGMAAQDAVKRLAGTGRAAPGDVSDPDQAEDIVATASKEGPIDILVNNAGIAEQLCAIDKQDPADWGQVVAVNLRGPYLMSRAVASRMKARRSGAIVNIASIVGLGGFPAAHAYGPAKAGLIMMTKTLAGELARHGIRVNAVAPGVIEAPMLKTMTADGKYLGQTIARVPMGRLGTPADIGGAVAFLSSELAAYITGTVLPVDGGWLAFAAAGEAAPPRG
ncbi:MAG: SDR family oxidoreductase [Novosphingobium sp.]|nr:SDR family oxidoreductase [Novosphingobium sp.]